MEKKKEKLHQLSVILRLSGSQSALTLPNDLIQFCQHTLEKRMLPLFYIQEGQGWSAE